MRRLFTLLILLVSAVARAQAPVSASTIYDGHGTFALLNSGQACFAATSTPVCFIVAGGRFSGSVPAGVYSFSVLDFNSHPILNIPSLSIPAAGWNFDTWVAPALTPIAPVFNGDGPPYTKCQTYAEYTINNPNSISQPGNPVTTLYSCGTASQNYQWFAAPASPPGGPGGGPPGGGSGGGGGPIGSDQQITFNKAGTMAGDANLLFGYSSGSLIVGGPMPANRVIAGPQSPVPSSWIFDWTTPSTATQSLGLSSATSSLNVPLKTPASSSSPCTVGDYAQDANYVYVCTATNTWKRSALTSF